MRETIKISGKEGPEKSKRNVEKQRQKTTHMTQIQTQGKEDKATTGKDEDNDKDNNKDNDNQHHNDSVKEKKIN